MYYLNWLNVITLCLPPALQPPPAPLNIFVPQIIQGDAPTASIVVIVRFFAGLTDAEILDRVKAFILATRQDIDLSALIISVEKQVGSIGKLGGIRAIRSLW